MRKLKLFFAVLALLVGGANSVSAQSWTEGAEVAAGDFYLYNIGAQRFLNTGSSWDTHCVADGQGAVITVSTQGDGYKLGTSVGGGKGPYVWDSWMNNDDGSNYWVLTPVSYGIYTNVYTFQMSSNTGKYMYWDGGGSGDYGNEVNCADEIGSKAENFYWLLIPKTTRQNLSAATTYNPSDVTYLIKNPDFESWSTELNNWTKGGFWKQNSSQTFANAVFAEKWSGTGLTTADKIYQSPTLKAGKYVLSATANASCTKAYLYASSESKQISAAGKYEVSFTVASEGSVELGVKIEADGTGNWVAFDNIRLYYLGNDFSSKITNPNFDSDASGWNGDAPSWGNNEIEFYNKTYDMYQDLTGLTAGIYAVEAQGFYRNGAGIDETRAKANESMLATLYAKGEDGVERNTTLLSIYEEAGKRTASGSLFGDIPNWMNQAQDFISNGYYNDNKVIVEVGAAGTLRIGAKKGTAVTNDWTILDNFSLTKLDYSTLTDAYAAEWTVRKAKAQALLNSPDYSNIVSGSTQRTALASAVALTPSDMEGYTAALVSLRTAVNNFKAAKYAYDLYATNAAAATEVYEAEATTYVNITGGEKTTFNTAYSNYVSSFSPATNNAENYYAAAVAIGDATAAFTVESIKNNYNEYAAEVATADLLGTDISGVSTPTTSSAALTAAHAINVLNYSKVVAEEYEDVSGSTLGAWTDNNVTTRRGQHWDGTTDDKKGTEYFEMNSGWGDTSWSMSRSQSVSLAAGKYILKVAARVSSYANATLSVTVGGNTISTISGHQGNTGLGITTSGEGCYTSHDTDDTKEYANSNAGRGFEWKYIPFEMAETGTATLSFTAEGHAQYQYVSFTSLALLTDPKVAARTTLLNKINESNTAYNSGANVGSGIFQVPSAAGSTFSTAISTAQGVYDDGDATLSGIESATSTLNTALTTYQGTTLNAPSSSTRYKLTLADRGTLSFDATGAADEGGYGLPFATAADYMAQTFFLTNTTGNNYNISFVDFDGNTRYICAGENAKEGIGNAKIRTTTDSSKALEITMSATTTANVFNMLNSEDSNNKIGSNGGGMYTANDYTSWSISEASQATVNVSIASSVKYGTRIFPFTPSLPSGVKAYSCGEADGAVLTLVEEKTPQANTPYILEAPEGCASTDLEGWGTATASEYTAGWLTGVYTSRAATDGTYVLQNNEGKVGFYKVNTSVAIPSVGAYRCYLTNPSGARPAFFFDDETTGIDAINALTSGSATIYSVDGHKLPALQKGLNIIKTDGKTYKVMVK